MGWLLCVDDESQVFRALARELGSAACDRVTSNAAASDAVHLGDVHVITTRWSRFPGKEDGLDLVIALRRTAIELPLMLYDDEPHDTAEIARAIKLGADDVLLDPLRRVAELVARLRSLQRRCLAPAGATLSIGGVRFDLRAATVTTADGEALPFTRQEVRLLLYLARRRGTCVSRDELLRNVFETEGRAARESNALPACASRLRQKLEGTRLRIVAVPGLGYRLEEGSGGATSGVHLVARVSSRARGDEGD